MKRILIAGTHSGCGKTTVTCALLSALKRRGLDASAFKCGPDYIDPMFHREVIGVPSHNLDSFFCDDDTLKYLLHEHAANSDIAVIEGVMGFYDGAGGRGSAHSLSMVTDTPAVVVIDCCGMSGSVGAVMRGFLDFRQPNNIAGFIFNRLPEKLTGLAERLCSELGTRYLGYLPKSDITIESRHLGLVTASEITGLREKLDALGKQAEKSIDIDGILQTAQREYPVFTPPSFPESNGSRPVIAVARDKAFCFIYDDNIELLKKLGCDVRYFSPLTDRKLPDNTSGLILCGGYPELYAEELSANTEMLDSIRVNIENGLPTIAECGGFMYLHENFEDMNGNEYSGAGVIRGKSFRTEKLQRFGYVTLTAKNDNLLCRAGETFRAHEFHYFDSTDCGSDMTAQKTDGREWDCVHANHSIYAGFPHLYFYSDIGTAESFANACREFMRKCENED
ncbi:MAG: cobyrinate a,c-diamide synthase [Ruminiclostridium sp.]|nr:cobyrinate a,c-diamide synthase [Ruminiclostridium sp.]